MRHHSLVFGTSNPWHPRRLTSLLNQFPHLTPDRPVFRRAYNSCFIFVYGHVLVFIVATTQNFYALPYIPHLAISFFKGQCKFHCEAIGDTGRTCLWSRGKWIRVITRFEDGCMIAMMPLREIGEVGSRTTVIDVAPDA